MWLWLRNPSDFGALAYCLSTLNIFEFTNCLTLQLWTSTHFLVLFSIVYASENLFSCSENGHFWNRRNFSLITWSYEFRDWDCGQIPIGIGTGIGTATQNPDGIGTGIGIVTQNPDWDRDRNRHRDPKSRRDQGSSFFIRWQQQFGGHTCSLYRLLTCLLFWTELFGPNYCFGPSLVFTLNVFSGLQPCRA